MAQKKVGIRQIAELSGMSIGNVSMVLNGRGDEARISKASQDRIFDAARQLQYKPNTYAKRLRMQVGSRLSVAVFFAPARNVAVVGSFFAGIHDLWEDEEDIAKRPEIVLHPYTQGRLKEMDDLLRHSFYDGFIFMGMSSEDHEYLETLDIPSPIVLFNRVSSRHHYVFTDNARIGRIAARVFAARGFQSPYLVTGQTPSAAGCERRFGFVDECRILHMPLPEEHILRVNVRNNGGREAAQLIPQEGDAPDALFLSEGNMGFSTLHGLLQRGFRIPQDLSLLCYSSGVYDEYTIPSLSSIVIPMEAMSRDCMQLLFDAIDHPESGQTHVTHSPILTIRESIR